MLLIVGSITACGGGSDTDAPGDGSACADAWGKAAKVSAFQDTPSDYRDTFTACSSVAEWDSENEAHGSRLGQGAATIDNVCRQLGVSSTLCYEASTQVQPALTWQDQQAPADLDSLACDAYFRDLPTSGDKLKVTDALLRRLNPGHPSFNLNVSLDFGSAVESECDPTGTGRGTPGVKVADVASRVYQQDPGRYVG